jgi:hypothetical protein
MKHTRSKCTWTACIAAIAVFITMSASADPPAVVPLPPTPANFGSAYISNVTSPSNCVYSDTNGGGIQFWDIQAGGTYTVTLSGVTDCANQGNDSSIDVIVHNTAGGNINATANQVDSQQGVYAFTITLSGQCLTMPIEYCTLASHPTKDNPDPGPGFQEGTGQFAQDNVGGAPGGHQGHLRTTIFDTNCVKQEDDTTCQPTPPPTASITACKWYDFNANGILDTGEQKLAGWPFCIDPLDNAIPQQATQIGGAGGCVTWSNLTPGSYQIREANANESNWIHSSAASLIQPVEAGQNPTVNFGNYCTVPSGGLTLGFWSNKNGNKLLTGSPTGTGTTLTAQAVAALNNCAYMRNANGSQHVFSNSYSAFRTWLLGATATNMAYMLSAQLAALRLDVTYGYVDANAFDLCSNMTVTSLMTTACDQLTMDGNTVSGNPTRAVQEHLKNCIDAINNNGPVVPVTPCPFTFPNPPAPCP